MPKPPLTAQTLRQLAGTWAAGFTAFLTWAIQGLLKQESQTPTTLLLISSVSITDAALIAKKTTKESES